MKDSKFSEFNVYSTLGAYQGALKGVFELIEELKNTEDTEDKEFFVSRIMIRLETWESSIFKICPSCNKRHILGDIQGSTGKCWACYEAEYKEF